jgi:hypothetical protein
MTLLEELEEIRKRLRAIEPKDCCKKQPMVAAGKTEMLCGPDCSWMQLETALMYVILDAEQREKQSRGV